MVNKISAHAMMQHIISRLGLRNNPDLPFQDIMSWMFEASRFIGSYASLEKTEAKVQITNYTGKFPLDMDSIIRVKDHPYFKSIRGGFQVDLQEGEVTIEYDKFPVDDRGLPLFIDDPSAKEAVMWYVAKFLAMQGLLPNGQMSHGYCDQQWQWYCGQARAEGFTPSIDQWERMVNVFYRLIPERDEYANEFKGLDTPEDLYLDPLNSNNGMFK